LKAPLSAYSIVKNIGAESTAAGLKTALFQAGSQYHQKDWVLMAIEL
jgi:hypothetical protein